MTRKLGLITCGAAKNPGKRPAKEKYSSNYFRLNRQYGEIICDEWRIVSAKHQLLDPEKEIDDYNLTIKDLSRTQRGMWIDDVTTGLLGTVRKDDIDEVHVLLGKDYQQALDGAFEELEDRGVKLVYPFEGTNGIGEQMSKVKELTTTYSGP